MKTTSASKSLQQHRENAELELLCRIAAAVYDGDPKENIRKREVVWARRAVYVQLRKIGMSFEAIGDKFGRDHASVLVACNKHRDAMKFDRPYKNLYDRYRRLLKSSTKENIELIRERVYQINADLLDMGFDNEYIDNFWKSSIETARHLKITG